MIYAERSATKVVSKRYDWSPELVQAIHALRFWDLTRKRSIGLKIGDTTLQREALKGGINLDEVSSPITYTSIMKYRSQARSTLRECRQNHIALREIHLTAVATARVESRGSSLTETNIQKEITQLKLREARRRMFKKIKVTLNPSSQTSGLARIDIPSCHTDSPFPDGPDPKLWKGPWKSITNPVEIAKHVSAANRRQYGQVNETPFGSKPLLPIYGYNADTPDADRLLEGHLPSSSILEKLYPETVSILFSLARPSPISLLSPCTTIGNDQFISLYKALNESTSSSPSGRHIGHY